MREAFERWAVKQISDFGGNKRTPGEIARAGFDGGWQAAKQADEKLIRELVLALRDCALRFEQINAHKRRHPEMTLSVDAVLDWTNFSIARAQTRLGKTNNTNGSE